MADEITPPEGGYTPDAAQSQIEDLLSGLDEPEETESEAEAEESEETEGDEVEETEESDDESQEAEEAADDEESEEEAPDINNLDDLVEALEVDKEDFLANLTVSTKVDGQTSEIALKDLIRGYQTDQHNTRRSQAFAEEKKAFDSQVEQKTKQMQDGLHQFGSMLQALEAQVVGQLDSDEMQRLRIEDPQQYLLKSRDAELAQHRFAQLKQAAANKFAETQQALKEQQEGQHKALVDEAIQKLPEVIPGWNSDKYQDMLKYAIEEVGIPADVAQNSVHWQLFVVLEESRLYRESMKKADVVKKRVKKTPKVVKKAAQTKPITTESKNLSQAKKRFKRSGSRKDAQSVVEQLLG